MQSFWEKRQNEQFGKLKNRGFWGILGDKGLGRRSGRKVYFEVVYLGFEEVNLDFEVTCWDLE